MENQDIIIIRIQQIIIIDQVNILICIHFLGRGNRSNKYREERAYKPSHHYDTKEEQTEQSKYWLVYFCLEVERDYQHSKNTYEVNKMEKKEGSL